MRIKILSLMIASTALCLSGCKNSSGNSTTNGPSPDDNDYSLVSLSASQVKSIMNEANENVFNASEIATNEVLESKNSIIFGELAFLAGYAIDGGHCSYKVNKFGKEAFTTEYEQIEYAKHGDLKYNTSYYKGKETHYLSDKRLNGNPADEGMLNVFDYDEYSFIEGYEPFESTISENLNVISVANKEADFAAYLDAYIASGVQLFSYEDFDGIIPNVYKSKDGKSLKIEVEFTYASSESFMGVTFSSAINVTYQFEYSIKNGQYYLNRMYGDMSETTPFNVYGDKLADDDNAFFFGNVEYTFKYDARKNIGVPTIKERKDYSNKLVLTEFDATKVYQGYSVFNYDAIDFKNDLGLSENVVTLHADLNTMSLYSLAFYDDLAETQGLLFEQAFVDNQYFEVISFSDTIDAFLFENITSTSKCFIKVVLGDDFATIKSVSVTPDFIS